jgi:hypothetical protein
MTAKKTARRKARPGAKKGGKRAGKKDKGLLIDVARSVGSTLGTLAARSRAAARDVRKKTRS